MKTEALVRLLQRVKSWPPAAQQEAFQSLREIEEDLTQVDAAQELEESRAQARQGSGLSLGELKEDLDL